MNMKPRTISFTVSLPLFLFLILSSCCKHAEEPGKANFVVRLKHHGEVIPNHISHPDTVWVKFNADEAPASLSGYDRFFVGSGTEDHIHMENMSCGKYFMYCAGLDSSSAPGERVVGGQAVKVRHRDRKKEVSIDLSVSE